MRKLFSFSMPDHWKRLPREIVESFSGYIQNQPGWYPVHPAPGECALAGRLDWMVFRDSFQSQPFNNSVKTCYSSKFS